MIGKSLLKIGVCFLVAFALNGFSDYIGSSFLIDFLKSNFTMVAITLFAINSATLSIVLTKIRELMDLHPQESDFTSTRNEIEFSIVEQLIIISASFLLFVIRSSTKFLPDPFWLSTLDLLIVGCFIWLLYIVYDTARSVLVVLDFKK